MRVVWAWIIGALLLLGGGILLQQRVLSLFSLNRNLSMEVYFPTEPCSHSLEFAEQLDIDNDHFALISNCFHSDAFQRSDYVWRFEQILPHFVYQYNSGDLGRFLQYWLQQPVGRIEQLPSERFLELNLLNQQDPINQMIALHFLCAHPDLLHQYPKDTAVSSWQQTQYALLQQCMNQTRSRYTKPIVDTQIKNSIGQGVLDVFNAPTLETFEQWASRIKASQILPTQREQRLPDPR